MSALTWAYMVKCERGLIFSLRALGQELSAHAAGGRDSGG